MVPTHTRTGYKINIVSVMRQTSVVIFKQDTKKKWRNQTMHGGVDSLLIT